MTMTNPCADGQDARPAEFVGERIRAPPGAPCRCARVAYIVTLLTHDIMTIARNAHLQTDGPLARAQRSRALGTSPVPRTAREKNRRAHRSAGVRCSHRCAGAAGAQRPPPHSADR